MHARQLGNGHIKLCIGLQCRRVRRFDSQPRLLRTGRHDGNRCSSADGLPSRDRGREQESDYRGVEDDVLLATPRAPRGGTHVNDMRGIDGLRHLLLRGQL